MTVTSPNGYRKNWSWANTPLGVHSFKKQSPPVREFFSLKGGPTPPKAGRVLGLVAIQLPAWSPTC